MELSISILCTMVAFMFPGRPALQTDQSVLELFPEYQAIKAELTAIKSRHNEIGTTYIRWSGIQCPNNSYTELVYSGYVGGGEYGKPGSVSEPVCLPKDPDLDRTNYRSYYGRMALMAGAAFHDYNLRASISISQDVPCAVCRVKASIVLMIPGRNMCYTGWNMEYNGYLASTTRRNEEYSVYGYPTRNHNAVAGSYICINIQAVRDRSWRHIYSKLFYGVKPKCGRGGCSTYSQSYFLECVVCSK